MSLLFLVYWPRTLFPHNGIEHATLRTSQRDRKTSVSSERHRDSVPVAPSKSSSANLLLRKPAAASLNVCPDATYPSTVMCYARVGKRRG